jgi:hypothetical protein
MELEDDVPDFAREENFTERYLEEYVTDTIPTWVAIDFQKTWDSALRFDFEISDRFVFSNH